MRDPLDYRVRRHARAGAPSPSLAYANVEPSAIRTAVKVLQDRGQARKQAGLCSGQNSEEVGLRVAIPDAGTSPTRGLAGLSGLRGVGRYTGPQVIDDMADALSTLPRVDTLSDAQLLGHLRRLHPQFPEAMHNMLRGLGEVTNIGKLIEAKSSPLNAVPTSQASRITTLQLRNLGSFNVYKGAKASKWEGRYYVHEQKGAKRAWEFKKTPTVEDLQATIDGVAPTATTTTTASTTTNSTPTTPTNPPAGYFPPQTTTPPVVATPTGPISGTMPFPDPGTTPPSSPTPAVAVVTPSTPSTPPAVINTPSGVQVLVPSPTPNLATYTTRANVSKLPTWLNESPLPWAIGIGAVGLLLVWALSKGNRK